MNLSINFHCALKHPLCACLALSIAAKAQQPPDITPAGSIPPGLQRQIDVGKKVKEAIGDAPRASGDARLYEAAKVVVARNDIETAKMILSSTNPFADDTAAFSLENGVRLTVLAAQLSKTPRRSGVAAIITHALAELDEAGRRAKTGSDTRLKSTIAIQKAYVHERFRGDAAAAIDSYRSALAVDPSNRAASEALGRLEAAVANLRSRGRSER